MRHLEQPGKSLPLNVPRALPVRWHSADRWLETSLPPFWRGWLTDGGSLTRKLIQASGNTFVVQVLRQGYRRPRPAERRALGLPPRQLALVREVVLYGAGTPWVYARSIIPLNTLSGRQRALRKLDARPLGALLFADRGMRRGPLEITRLRGALIPDHLAPPSALLWGRRSLFFLDGKPLLVSEIFLPDFDPAII